jgi:hypothetical protein
VLTFLVRSAMVAYYPRTETLPGVEDCDLDAFIEKFREETTMLMWLGVVVSAILFHLTPLFTVFIPLPAFMLSEKALDRHAHKISTTNVYLVRQIIYVARMYGGLCWGTHPEVRKRFALPPLGPDPGTWRSS